MKLVSRIVAAAVVMTWLGTVLQVNGQGRSLTPDEMANFKKLVEEQSRPKTQGANPLKVVKKLTGHEDGILTVRFSPDGKVLASGSGNGTIILWEVASGKQLQVLKGHKGMVMGVDFSSDGKRLVSGGADGQVLVWNVGTGELEAIWTQPYPAMDVVYLPGKEEVASGCYEDIRVWKVGADTPRVLSSDDSVMSLGVTKEGMIISGDWKGTLVEWDPATGKRVLQKSRPETSRALLQYNGRSSENHIQALHVMGNGDVLLSDVEAMWRWDLKKNEVTYVMHWPTEEIDTFDGDRVILDVDMGVIMHDFGRDFQFRYSGKGMIHAIAISPAGDYVAVGAGGHRDANWKWFPGGATDVELMSLPDLVKAGREAEASAAKRHAAGEKQAIDPLDMVSPGDVEKTKSVGWK